MSSTLRFRLGEIAVYIGPTPGYSGQEVEVVLVGPIPAWEWVEVDGMPRSRCVKPSDYIIRAPDGAHAFVDDASLRKRPERGIPESVLRIFEAPIKRSQPA